jgi:hypothetical protein
MSMENTFNPFGVAGINPLNPAIPIGPFRGHSTKSDPKGVE